MALDYTYIVTDDSIFVSAGSSTWLVSAGEAEKYAKLKRLIRDKAELAAIRELLDTKEDERLRKWCENQFKDNEAGITVGSDTVEIDGEPVYGGLCTQILSMYEDDIPLEPIVNFVRKMRQNPSYKIRAQLWSFISACQKDGGFTLSNDGDIMAYKVVKSDFTDCHTGTFDNHPGCIVEMPRWAVDDDPSHVCSAGLHFCAYSYVRDFSRPDSRLVLVKINPKDVVSIPDDYGHAKARCCRYEVVDEIKAPLKKPVYDERRSEPSVWLETTHRILGKEIKFSFKSEDSLDEFPLEIGDVVEAYLKDYDEGYHIGVLMQYDSGDDDLPWQIGFIDHSKNMYVTWWVPEDNILYPDKDDARQEEEEWFSKFDSDDSCIYGRHTSDREDDEDSCAFSEGDTVLVPVADDLVKAKIQSIFGFNGRQCCSVANEDGSVLGIYPLEDLSRTEESRDEAIQKLHLSLKEMCDKAGIDYGKIYKLASDLADTVFNQAECTMKDIDEEDEEEDPESFVENWLADAGRQKTARFIESRYSDLMDSSLRLRLAVSAKDYRPQDIKEILGCHLQERNGRESKWIILSRQMKEWDNK